MQIWPAIDLRGGRCVRLRQGDYRQETVFGDDPAGMARQWVAQGARQLHLVDLDGARDGQPRNQAAVAAILSAVEVACQLGGGIRHEDRVRELLELGISRVVIGTRAVEDPQWFARLVADFPQRIALGIDAREGRVATHGWLATGDVAATELALRLATEDLGALIYTDIHRDGMLAGPNFAALAEMQRVVPCPLIASGGITTAADVACLAAMDLAGCIIGRALYEGTLTLAAAIAAAGGCSAKGGPPCSA